MNPSDSEVKENASLPTPPSISNPPIFPGSAFTLGLSTDAPPRPEQAVRRAITRPSVNISRAVKSAREPCGPYEIAFRAADLKGFSASAAKLWSRYYDNLRDSNDPLYLQLAGPSYAILKSHMDELDNGKDTGAKYYFITVNCAPRVTPQLLCKKVEKCLKKKWIESLPCYWIFNIEQRGTTLDTIHGFHSHIVLERPSTKRLSEFKREIRSSFSSLVDTEPAIDIKPCKEGTEHRVINYVKGLKIDPSKLEKVTVDKAWRAKVGLQDYYESDLEGGLAEPPEYGVEDDESESGSEAPSGSSSEQSSQGASEDGSVDYDI